MKFVFAALLLILSIGCDQKTESEKMLEQIKKDRFVDSMVNKVQTDALFDTSGISNAPVKVLKAIFVEREHSKYKDVSITYKNVSDKDISAVRFKWYGINAFGRPADAGMSLEPGFGGGFSDDLLRKGKTRTSVWAVLSNSGKKINIAWPVEIVFTDGTKWEVK